MQNNIYETFQQAFIGNIQDIFQDWEYQEPSRNGEMLEIIGYGYTVTNPKTFVFENKQLGRISYDYAEDFYQWMISGSTEEETEKLANKYSHVSNYLDKPKSPDLPDNFNVFYGPRILRQLPLILEELERNRNSRRAVINILQESDLQLLDKDETLEFPCCDSAQFTIRNNRLNLHVHMRSNNMANVAKLDMYLWGRFLCETAYAIDLPVGKFVSTIGSAHVFTKDVEYLQSIGVLS